MSTTTIAIAEAAGVISEESHRVAALGPVITQGQLMTSCHLMRLALAQLEGQVLRLPAEHPAAPVPEHSTLGEWP